MKYHVCSKCYTNLIYNHGRRCADFWTSILRCCEDEGAGVFEFCSDSLELLRVLENYGFLVSTEMNHYERLMVVFKGFIEGEDDFLAVCFHPDEH